jgi:hypothetical protein
MLIERSFPSDSAEPEMRPLIRELAGSAGTAPKILAFGLHFFVAVKCSLDYLLTIARS